MDGLLQTSAKGLLVTRSRRPTVQAEIDLVLAQPPTQWLEAAPRLKAETLASLARELLVRGEDRILGSLVVDHIDKRATPIAARNCRGLSPDNTQEVIESLHALIHRELLYPKADGIHYMEISFGSFVKRKTLNLARDARKRCAHIVSLDDQTADATRPMDPQEFERQKREFSRRQYLKIAIDRVLPSMPKEIRVAFEFWFYHDIPIETKKPGAQSIERLVARDKRTVHLWLRKVFAALATELGETQ